MRNVTQLHSRYRKWTLAAMAAVLLLMPAASFAADETVGNSEEITLSPVTQKKEVDGGQSFSDTFKVLNTGASTFDFKVYAQPYSVEGKEYSPNYTSTEGRADANSWVEFGITESSLKPGESMDIGYTVNVPQNAAIGGHYAVLFAETQPSEDGASQQVLRKKRVGMILRVNISGDIRQQGDVVASALPFLQFKAPLRTSFDIDNTGNVDFDVSSAVIITDIFGNLKYNSEKSNTVFPETTRRVEQNWNDAGWLGIYKVDLSASYLEKDFHTSRYVLMIPQWLIILVIMVIVGGTIAIYIRR